ncbi:hypothetical protein L249_6432 [Ophiocordyceps polyrhachis-furcata BCC 54312]|uniref:Uncharacterized protein n=1 Tax=Ophiocordyceps polyrhachis-furcata BCC 54312 TaxID=1330021 RepID=A0A367LJX4_9HYPO|nr:hypothetical protein L249_6432 [Ophiocordyceps polyrhachis-furcata BCC 54312]
MLSSTASTLEAIKKKCNAALRVTFALIIEEIFTIKAETFATFGAFSYADLIDNTKKDAFSANLSRSGTKTQDRGRGRGRGGRGRGRGGRGSQGGRPSSSSPSIIIGPNGRRETNHGFRFIEISKNTTLDPFRAANSGDLLP